MGLTPDSSHSLVHPLLTPPVRPLSPHLHLPHRPLKHAQVSRVHPPNHVRPAPIGKRLGLERDARQKLRRVRVRVPDELVKVAPRRRRDGGCATALSAPCGRGCGAHEEGPVEGKGLSACVFVAPELDELDGVAAEGDLDGGQYRRDGDRGVAWGRDKERDRGRGLAWNWGGGNDEARRGVGRVSLRHVCNARRQPTTGAQAKGIDLRLPEPWLYPYMLQTSFLLLSSGMRSETRRPVFYTTPSSIVWRCARVDEHIGRAVVVGRCGPHLLFFFFASAVTPGSLI
jgi:hypothetical protein